MDDRQQKFDDMKSDMAARREAAMKRSGSLKDEVDKAVATLSQPSVSAETRDALVTRYSTIESLTGVSDETIRTLIETFEAEAARSNGNGTNVADAIGNLNRLIQARA